MPSKKRSRDLLVLIDGNALIHRAFHAIPPLTAADGTVINAVFGFSSILLKVLADLKPKYIAVTFDKKKKTFRHKLFKEYKATREKAPQELYDQFPLVKDVVRAFNIPLFEKDEFEADDLIGTLSARATSVDVMIVTGDLDTLQLINDRVRVYTPKQGAKDTMVYDTAQVLARFGLTPRQMIEYKALRGDTSDNIPGVKGVGEKTAITLLRHFGTIEKLYEFLHATKDLDAKALIAKLEQDRVPLPVIKVLKGKMRERLLDQEHMARLSREIGTIVLDVPIEFDLSACRTDDFDRPRVIELFKKFQFRSLMPRIPASGHIHDIKAGAQMPAKAVQKEQPSLFPLNQEQPTPKQPSQPTTLHEKNYIIVQDVAALKTLAAELKKQKQFALDTETERLDHVHPGLVGISLSYKPFESYYIPVAHSAGRQIPKKDIQHILNPIFSDPSIKKIGHNIKYDYVSLLEGGFELQGIWFDTMIAAYLLQAGSRNLSISDLALVEFGETMQEITELIGEGTPKRSQHQIPFSEVPIDKAAPYAAADADVAFRLFREFEPRIKQLRLDSVLHEIDVPLIPVLAHMERSGISLDTDFLAQLSKQYRKRILKLEDGIYKAAGTNFNINSTQQLSAILFEKLKISSEGIHKTKTRFSTAARELEKLKGKHKIIAFISEYRELEKLRNTYVDALPQMVRPDTGRVHTNFNQVIAATGRLSSIDPNLQNIPIRTDAGREIRNAFVAARGFRLLSLDYSQIELRIVAHVANDKQMIKAFADGEDIHLVTASHVFQVDPKDVTQDMRRKAKAVNFGMIYGMSPFGLAGNLGIPVDEARAIIDSYFATYSGVRAYMDDAVVQAEKLGYAQTLFGRKRFIPELKAKNFQLRQAGQRVAINMPIQGTQADIIKKAMISIDQKLAGKEADIQMLLQVHDELVFEVKATESERFAKICKIEMEHAYSMSVPLLVEAKIGPNWGTMEKLKL